MATITLQNNIPTGSTIIVVLKGDNSNTNRFVSFQNNIINFLPVTDGISHQYIVTITSPLGCTDTEEVSCTVGASCNGTLNAGIKCRLYRVTNNTVLPITANYRACGTFQSTDTIVNANTNVLFCAIAGTVTAPSGITILDIGSC